MTAVLLDSTKIGASGWIATRRSKGIKVSGMVSGERLSISFLPEREDLFVAENGCFPLPVDAKQVKVAHVEVVKRVNGNLGVCVDLVEKI